MTDDDLWELEFWENENGNCPIADVLDAIKKKNNIFYRRILKKIEFLKKNSIEQLFKANYLEDLKNGLWELKIHAGNEFRMLGILRGNNLIIIYTAVHAFHKKSKKIKNKDINLALNRLKSII